MDTTTYRLGTPDEEFKYGEVILVDTSVKRPIRSLRGTECY